MSIQKIIKIYFIFVMTIVSMSILSVNKNFENLIISVFHTSSGLSTEIKTAVIVPAESSILTITNQPEKAYASPGAKDIELMKFVFKADSEDIELKSMILKTVGVPAEKLKKVVLKDEDSVSESDGISEYFLFKNIGFMLKSGEKKTLSLRVDLGENLHAGDRFRMDIEKLVLGGKADEANFEFPIIGKYLSIVKR